MSLADDLSRLEEMRGRGALSDDEFQRAKARLLGAAAPPAADNPAVQAINRLRRSRSDRWIAGVCGGLAAATGVDLEGLAALAAFRGRMEADPAVQRALAAEGLT